jgi:hypothetical protein
MPSDLHERDAMILKAVRDFVGEEIAGLGRRLEAVMARTTDDLGGRLARVEKDLLTGLGHVEAENGLAVREVRATIGEIQGFARVVEEDRAARVARTSATFAEEVRALSHWLELCTAHEGEAA